MLEQNPFLETEEDLASSTHESPAERGQADKQPASDERETGDGSGEAEPEIQGIETGSSASDDWENGTEGDDFDGIGETPQLSAGLAAASDGSGGGDDEAQDRSAPRATLQEHLRGQVVGMRLDDDERAALLVLIESLNDDGYLADPLEDIGARLAEMLGVATREAREDLDQHLSCALHWLQAMEPTGVGARSLGECIALQLRQLPPCEARAVALQICEHHLDLLARRDMRKLTALTGASEDRVREAQQLIRACEPKPGRPFADAESNIVVPDVIVRKSGRGLVVTLNPDVMPKLRVNDIYAKALRAHRGSPGQPLLSSHLQEARWFVKNIMQRFDTSLRVSKAIVERQKSFFTHGDIAMKPLVLREIADELGLHESTISRVTTAKYMATIYGTFELKYFFGSSLGTDAGGNASSTAVRALIQQFVGAENPGRPLSDSQLSQMLEEQGIHVARRTVAKYRDALKIAPTNLRKAI